MKSTIEGRSVRQKMTTSDLKTVENACDEALRWDAWLDVYRRGNDSKKASEHCNSTRWLWCRWLEVNRDADLEELQERRKVAEAACGPCITRLYQVVRHLPPFSTVFIFFAGIWSDDARHGRAEHGRPHLQRRRRGEEEEGQGEEALSPASKCFLSQFCRPFSNTLLLVSMICRKLSELLNPWVLWYGGEGNYD